MDVEIEVRGRKGEGGGEEKKHKKKKGGREKRGEGETLCSPEEPDLREAKTGKRESDRAQKSERDRERVRGQHESTVEQITSFVHLAAHGREEWRRRREERADSWS